MTTGAERSQRVSPVEDKVVLPEGGDPELTEFLRSWAPKHPYDPRLNMGRNSGKP